MQYVKIKTLRIVRITTFLLRGGYFFIWKCEVLAMKMLVIDGNSILNRAFFGIKLLTTKDGQYTNAIFGFMTTLEKVLSETKPDAVAIAFDMRAPTFRHKAYDGYKAKRKGMPNELASQMKPLKELLTLLGYKIVECEGYEADDILGTLAATCTKNGDECVIATGDRDSLQLVSPTVNVRIAATKLGKPEVTLYDEVAIMEKYGVTPKQLIEIKAIQGDTSDNIPGVPGIGEKGAGDLIKRFGNIDYIYENIDTIEVKDGIRKKLIAGKESAYLSHMLGTICVEAPIDTDISNYVPAKRDSAGAARLMASLELFKLIDKLGLSDEEIPVVENKSAKLKKLNFTDDFDYCRAVEGFNGKTVSIACKIEDKQISEMSVLCEDNIYMFSFESFEFISSIRSIFESKDIKKQLHDIKPVVAVLLKNNIEPVGIVCDTILASYLLNPNSSDYSIERLIQEYNPPKFELEENAPELAKECAEISALSEALMLLIDEKEQTKLLDDIEIPLAIVLADMENCGFMADRNGIVEYNKEISAKLDEITKEIYAAVGYEFNINSPKQLGSALFEKLALPHGKKTKSGYSTSAEVLESLKYEHPAVALILQYRTYSKLKSTYCDGLLKVIGEDGRIHSSFNQTETRTGRISSTEPNLQNIPVRTELGRELRRFFMAKDGCVLVDADYSQIELRVLAHIAKDSAMIEAFKNNEDIHSITASQVFKLPPEMVTKTMRSRAKAVNFGIVYGIGAFSLSKDIGVTRKEADNYIKNYLAHYSGVDEYMKRTVEDAKRDGYVTTMFGRRRYLPELTSSNFNLRAFGERVARNMPIQGTSADIIKIAMIRVRNRLKAENMQARLILQVHDELIVEAPENEADRTAKILEEEMENAVKLNVPLIADAGKGKTWYDAKA